MNARLLGLAMVVGLSLPVAAQAQMLAPGGYNPHVEPKGRATRPYDGRPMCAGNNTCNPVCPIGAKYDATRHVNAAVLAGAGLIVSCSKLPPVAPVIWALTVPASR